MAGSCWMGCMVGDVDGSFSNKGRQCDLTVPQQKKHISWGDLPPSILAYVLSCLTFRERCQAGLVSRQWEAIITSAAAHSRDQSHVPLPATRLLPADVDATSNEGLLRRCKALRHVRSAAVTLDGAGADLLQHTLTSLTRLVVLDPVVHRQMHQHEREAWVPLKPRRHAIPASLQQRSKLAVLSIAMSSPLLDVHSLPASLQALHLELASGYSEPQLHALCEALADAASALPQLQHISLGLELDTLLTTSHADVLNPLSGLTQLTSLGLVDYQYMHPDSSAHEGYAVVPPVLQLLPQLSSVEVRINSGQRADLAPAAVIPDVNLALTLAHYEQEPFNRLPPSLVLLTGLTSLSILMAEFDYDEARDLYVFDARPLTCCPKLHRLLLELHGVKSSLHDLQGLASLTALTELVVLLKCPDVHEARPEGVARPASLAGSQASTNGSNNWPALLPGAGWQQCNGDGSGSHGSSGGSFLATVQKVPGRLLSLLDGTTWGRQQQQQQQQHGGSNGSSDDGCEVPLVNEEWVLALLDHALDQIRPEFALALPEVSGRLLVATTCRLCLRQADNFAVAVQPMLLASNLRLDLAASGDCPSGESFLQPTGPGALRSWVARQWAPRRVHLVAPARYPVLGTYAGCSRRIDDKLLVAARHGTSSTAVVRQIMAVAEERCLSYFM